MIRLKNFSFKGIIFLVSLFIFITLSMSYTFSMHYIFSSTITNQMYLTWKNQINTISEQSRFSIITESETEILRIVKLIDNPLIKHLGIYTSNKPLYLSGIQNACKDINHSTDVFINADRYFCFNKRVTNKYNDQQIGHITMIVSKDELNTLITDNLFSNAAVTLILTSIIFSFLYFSVKKILSPLTTLSTVMNKISNNDRGLRLNNEGTKDMIYIQKTFNNMISTIEEHEAILDQKVIERTLKLSQAYQDAKGASKVKSDILKIVSHEMKTPLTSIMLNLHLMQSGKGYFVPEIIEDTERLQLFIDNLLVYSCAVENKVELNKSLFSVANFLDKIMTEFTPLLKTHNNLFKLDNTYHGMVFSDEKLVKQILSNFITNANKFTSKGEITVKCYTTNNNLLLSIIDTGCGICDSNLEKIFDSFWQVDMSSKRNYEGTGLGLSICRLFAEVLGGNITVKSKLKIGSEFTLSLLLPPEN